jgi:hypothetical protein
MVHSCCPCVLFGFPGPIFVWRIRIPIDSRSEPGLVDSCSRLGVGTEDFLILALSHCHRSRFRSYLWTPHLGLCLGLDLSVAARQDFFPTARTSVPIYFSVLMIFVFVARISFCCCHKLGFGPVSARVVVVMTSPIQFSRSRFCSCHQTPLPVFVFFEPAIMEGSRVGFATGICSPPKTECTFAFDLFLILSLSIMSIGTYFSGLPCVCFHSGSHFLTSFEGL